ncbi:uncharacterized protein KRP23_13832 [Phytophthora ramorum]|uniref:uncharacterized protein n=1 Tax=Phytophthora ramorum TaxID=164328 RepID=UPI0030B73EC6|nr:hypothetical protein KRP23_13832 [Phytophthora ramorum]
MADPTTKTKPSLHFTIRSRLEQLKQQCHEVCGDVEAGRARKVSTSGTTSMHEFFSSVQLWKERSLHHTLETLDKAGASSMDSHVEAMENHERGAKDLFELTRVFLGRSWHGVNLHLDAFTDDLAALIDSIVTSRIEEQRLVHDSVVAALKEEAQRLVRACQELKSTNGDLEDRLEVLENTADKGGDVILCNILRARVQHLTVRNRELAAELQIAAQERVKHRRDMEKAKAQLANTQNSLALTRAMHDKETRQLAALLQLNHAQVAQVLEASRDTGDPRRQQQPMERFDPLSGCTIVHLSPIASPQKPSGSPSSNSPRRGSSPVLTTSPVPTQRETLPSNPRQRVDRPKSAGPRRRSATSNDKASPTPARRFRPAQA